MNLNFDVRKADGYSSNSQIARILTESWVKENSFCPNCGHFHLSEFENNRPVADFFCKNCSEEYELKSKGGNRLGEKIADGAYSTMIERINSANNPNFFFLNYNKSNWSVSNFLMIPKHYFVPEIIIQRKPLADTARRAGWVGCNIDISKIPESGRVFIVKDSKEIPKDRVEIKLQSTSFLKHQKLDSRGWIMDIMNCVDKIQGDNFTLEQIYAFENQLKLKYPENNHIRDKIRQQLQYLRDKGVVEFTSRGNYKKVKIL
jgi:type II restriction enzyme